MRACWHRTGFIDMQAGKLDQRVTLERRQGGTDSWGQPLPDDWTALCTVWAAVEPLVGREYMAAAAMQSDVSTRVRMRYRPGVTAGDRLSHEGRIYNIESVIDFRSAKRELVLMVRG